jgi:hypothetical protein
LPSNHSAVDRPKTSPRAVTPAVPSLWCWRKWSNCQYWQWHNFSGKLSLRRFWRRLERRQCCLPFGGQARNVRFHLRKTDIRGISKCFFQNKSK